MAAAQAVEWAEELGLEDAISLLQETLEEEKATDKGLGEIAKTAVNQQARQPDLVRGGYGVGRPSVIASYEQHLAPSRRALGRGPGGPPRDHLLRGIDAVFDFTGTRKSPAGIWRETKEHSLFAFLTTQSNDIVRPIHAKAMPVLLTKPEDWDTWLTGSVEEAVAYLLTNRLKTPLRIGKDLSITHV